ncbi:hypothetical protein GIS00_04300 [Nakamurella sp. YIM 132087]|uniref:Putative sensor domain-containing protein n=1 Tax=Nakamurella alba TaxID=2665158 RepID=A0A7K1FGC6_9ACTN|nr:sensor domain-containing protein [Nakamurella alba]MTD13167.1 hypothetical protein [Nakamurella alba]
MATTFITGTTTFADPTFADPTGYGHGAGPSSPVPGRVRRHSPAGALGDLVYCLVGLAPAIFFFVVPVTLLAVGIGTAVIYVGLPVLAAGLLVARAGGLAQLALGRSLLGLPLSGPAPIVRRGTGPIGRLTGVLADPGCWKAFLYHCFSIAFAPLRFGVAIGLYAYGVGAVTYPFWRGWLPEQVADDGSVHRAAQWGHDFYLDTVPRMALLMAIGIGVLWIAPRVVRALVTVDRLLITGLLAGPGRS